MAEDRRGLRPDPIPAEARRFQGLRAGVVTRTTAGAIDYTLIAIVTIGTWLGYVVLKFLIDPRNLAVDVWPAWVFIVLGYVYMVLYLMVGWRVTGRSFGSRLMGLRVVDRKGRRLSWPLALVRAALCTLVPVALFWCVISRENRSAQDVLLRTSVIHDWPVRKEIVIDAAEERAA
jgi:uncharacterized RDD family membrane protein YckC